VANRPPRLFLCPHGT